MCLGDSKQSIISSEKAAQLLNLDKLRKAIPPEAFEKNVFKSLAYMFFDYFMWGASLYAILKCTEPGIWDSMPFWQQALASLAYWNISGFFMWCIFVVGHDCGHGTFSNSEIFNDIIGHFTHGSILVPYWPWQLSHRRHHMFHNHIDKDYSHPWYTPDKLEKPDEHLARMMEKYPFIRFFFPFVGWPLYLYGMPDGSHWIPFRNTRLWEDADFSTSVKCLVSTFVVVVNLTCIYFFLAEQSVMRFVYYYAVPWVVSSWWLVTVTYLQHHDHDTVVYDDQDWKFVHAAFETVDRKFGFGIDSLHHHITDGHVAHHLFFTKIPHFNLPIATKAIRKYLEENNLGALYKSDITYDFPIRVHKYMVQFGLSAKRYTPLTSKKSD
jgi:omega-3 fatty acid desaturase (delta-15 desaturase)